jgi:hypothetical protein
MWIMWTVRQISAKGLCWLCREVADMFGGVKEEAVGLSRENLFPWLKMYKIRNFVQECLLYNNIPCDR